jgi:hypothetical protein
VSSLRRHRFFLLAVLVALAVGVVLRWGALGVGFHGDDHVQIGMLRGQFPAPRSAFDLFRFADAARDGQALMDFGYDPWWSDPKLKIALFRPLSSGLMALDNAVFGPNPVVHHVHSFVWWALLMLAAAAFFRALLPERVAAIAILLCAIEEAQTVPITWLANRSTLVSTAFGLFGLLLHVKFRQSGRLGLRIAEGVAFGLALAGGEYGFAVLAYVAAYELFGTDDPIPERLRALVPAVAPSLVWVVLVLALGYGAHGSGAYISPTESPAEFARAAVERVPVLVGDLVWGIPATWWGDGMPWAPNPETGRKWQSFLGAAGIAALVLVARFSDRLDERYRSVRWLAAGALLSVVPSSGALPEDRTLVAAAVGVAAVIAVVISLGWDAAAGVVRRKPLGPALLPLAVAGFAVYIHGVKAWTRSSQQQRWLAHTIAAQRRWALGAEIPDQGLAERRVVILTGADFTTIVNLPWVRMVAGHPLPKSYWRLSGAVDAHDIFRIAPNVIDVAVLSSRLEDTMVGSLYRPRNAGFKVGDVVTQPGLKVEIQTIKGPHPWRTRFTFERSLDDPYYLFLHSTPEGIRPFTMPAVGERQRMPAPARSRL